METDTSEKKTLFIIYLYFFLYGIKTALILHNIFL